jgi:hypothetical protein
MGNQKGERIVDRRRRNHMIILQDQHKRHRYAVEIMDERYQHPFCGRGRLGMEHGQRLTAQLGMYALGGGNQVNKKVSEIIIIRVKRKPCTGLPTVRRVIHTLIGGWWYLPFV